MDSCLARCEVMVLILVWLFASLAKLTTAYKEEATPVRGDHEKRLLYDIFTKRGYNPLIRPVKDNSERLTVNFSLALSQIIDVDEKNQMMKTNVWLQVYWSDYQLQWNPVFYGNIENIRLHPDLIWVPDFVLFNNADGNFEVTYKSNTVISHDSTVYWIPPSIYKSSCTIDVQYFPFDQQVCEMQFGSWTHKGKALKYYFYKNMTRIDLGDYLKSGSWDIIDCPGRIEIMDIYGEEKELIIFKFILRRKTLFYTVNLIIPCVLISFVSVCVFALPADAGEKITMCISVLLALVVFLLLVSKILPPSLTIPLIAKYLLFTFIMNLIAIFSTVVIINRNFRTPRTHQMPNWVRVVFIRELPKYLFMTRPDHEERSHGKPPTSPSSRASTLEYHRENVDSCRSNDFLDLAEVHHPHCRLNTPSSIKKDSHDANSNSSSQGQLNRNFSNASSFQQDNSSPDYSNQLTLTPELHKTIDSIKFIHNHLMLEEEYDVVLEDWKYVARVLDRFLLIIFLLVTISGTAGILLNAPHIMEYVDQEKIIADIMSRLSSDE